MNRRATASIAANPVLIGAVTTLIVVVAVFLAYNANNGLPFVPMYSLKAEVPNASGLIKGNEVRMGGARVGVVRRIEPLVTEDGTTGAVLHLELDRTIGELPRDTKLRVRPRSPLGLKYVELTKGRAAETYADHSTIPLASATPPPVEIDEFFGMWDEPTREGSSGNLREFGAAFAGRGRDLSDTFRALRPLVEHVEPALRALADETTEFDELFPAFEQAASEVAPVAETQGRMFTALDTTFGALSSVAPALEETIARGPQALEVATRELTAQASFVRESEELFRRLRPGFRSLASSSVHTARAFRVGQTTLKGAPDLNRRLIDMLAALERFSDDDRVSPALRRLTRTAGVLEPTIAFLAPAQTTCNYAALLARNLASAMSDSDVIGSFLRFGTILTPQLPGSEAGPAATPANGPASDKPLELDSFLHSNPNPNTAAPGQTRECEAGNERYLPRRQVIGNQPGAQGTFSESTKEER